MRRADALALLAILLCVLLVNAPAVGGWLDADPMLVLSGLDHAGRDGLLPGGPGWTDPNTGTTTQALGHLSALDWLAGVMPWWNPYSGVGLPLAAAMQPASLFLPFVLLLFFRHGMLWLKITMQVIAGAGTYALLRQMGVGRRGALAGGLIFAVNGTFGWHGAYAPALPPAFLPMILLGVERAAARARGGVAVLALGLAWSLYAGFPETAYAGALLAAAWALLRIASPGPRARVLGRIVAGGALGLMLAAPVLLPFAEFMAQATLGPRHGGFGLFAFPPKFASFIFFPHIVGLPSGLWVYDREHAAPNLFALNGGWIGLGLLFLAWLALLGSGRQRPLRWLLAGWIALSFLKTMAVPGVTQTFNLIPGVSLIPWFRYGPPGWEMAAAVLAGLAVDDWRRGLAPAGRRALLALALTLAPAGASLWAGEPVFRSLLRTTPHYAFYLAGSVAGGLLLLGLLAWAWSRRPLGWRRTALLLAVVLEPALLFFVPMLAGRRDIALDLGTVSFLQRNLGLQRFASWGSLQANYGAYWRIASINYEYIPVPPAWWEHVRTRLDPGAAIFSWRGQMPTTAEGKPLPPDALPAVLSAYAADGVKYLLVRPGLPAPALQAAPPSGERNALSLPAGGWIAGELPAAAAPAGPVYGVSVLIGTYGGTSTGELQVELCAGDACESGRAALAGAADNVPLLVRFPQPLTVRGGEALRWRISHPGPANGVAVWLYADAPGTPPGIDSPWGRQAGHPAFAFDPGPQATAPRLVHTGPAAQVWELPNPKPYFEVIGGPCRLAGASREKVDSDCAAPARLLRRELFYPGWTVRVNGAAAAITRGQDIFQEVALPGGQARVRFGYAPPFIGVGYGMFLLGLLGLGGPPLWRSRRALTLAGMREDARRAAIGLGDAGEGAWNAVFGPGAGRRGAALDGLLLAGFALLAALRLPAVWVGGRFWAEEGVVYFAAAWTMPWYDSLFLVHTGYLNLAASAATTLAAHLVGLAQAPLLTTLLALLMQLCPAVLLAGSGIPWLRSPAALGAALLMILLPQEAAEVWLNTITSQFHVMLALAIVLAAPPGRGATGWLARGLLLLGPLAGPGGGMLLPLFLLRAWLERSPARAGQAALLLPGVLVQVAVVLLHPEPGRGVGLDLPVVLAVIAQKQILLPLLGPGGLNRLLAQLQARLAAGQLPPGLVLAPLVVFGLLGAAAWAAREAALRWMFAAAIVLMLASWAFALTPSGTRDLFVPNFGGRYAFAPAALIELVVLGLALQRRGRVRWPARIAAVWLLVCGAFYYPRVLPFYAEGPSWQAEVTQWRSDPGHPLAIWPRGWAVRLAAHPPAQPPEAPK